MDLRALTNKLDAARNTFDYRLERVLFDLAEQMCALTEKENVNRTELARRMGVSPAYITKILNGNPNLTIKSLLKLSDALGRDLTIAFAPKTQVAQFSAALPETIEQVSTEYELGESWESVYVASRAAQAIHAEESDDSLLAA